MPLMYLHAYEVMCFLVAKASKESNNTAPDKRSGPRARHAVRRVLITSRDFHAWSRLSAPLTLPYLSICTFSYTLITRPYIAPGRMDGDTESR